MKSDKPDAVDRKVECHGTVPRHVGIILDGNRRWARARGYSDVSEGHRIGFGKIPDVLEWCDEIDIGVVTLWMLSDDNIANRPSSELDRLYRIQEEVILGLAGLRRWRLHAVGASDLLPRFLAGALRSAERMTFDVDGMTVNLALGHGGREDLLSAVRLLVTDILHTGDRSVSGRRLAAYLSTAGQPDVDLLIRTSGEVRTSGFLLWQSAMAELYFCDKMWPDFDKTDLIDALAAYRRRQRRFGA